MHKKRIFRFFRGAISVALAISLMLGEVGAGVSTVYASTTTQSQQVEENVTEEETVVSEAEVNGSSDYGLASNIQDGAILHCFNWKYSDIKAELANIAEAGFTSVQTSPAQRGASNSGPWYWLYQPLGFWIADDNGLGTKAELQALCTEADKYGIKVIVDVVANHLAGDHSNIQNDLKDSQYWHTHGGDINYENRWEVTHGDIGMKDIASENSYVQQVVAKYVQELKGIGVDGIRWDAAKHIEVPGESDNCQFWPTVIDTDLYNYGEILVGPMDKGDENTMRSLMNKYTEYMSVTDNEYAKHMRESLKDGNINTSIGNWSERGVAKNKLVYWAESHDTFSNNGEYGEDSRTSNQNQIDRTYAIMAAQGKSSALYFSRPSQTQKANISIGAKGSTAFASKEVAAVNHFKNAVIGEKEYYVAENNVAAVCRESGAVIVKGKGSGQVSITNGGGYVAPGTYTDEVSGSTWTVTSTTISGSVGDSGIAVICNKGASGAGISASLSDGSSFTTDSTSVTFTVTNAKSATYSIDGGTATNFSDSIKLTLGEETALGGSVTVTIKATNEEGKTTEKKFTYTKADPNAVAVAQIVLPAGWSEPIYCYAYDSATEKITNSTWPGEKMTKVSGTTNVYEYTIPTNIDKPRVIFYSSDTNRTPANMVDGYLFESIGTYRLDGSSWSKVSVAKPTNTPTPKPTNTPTTKPTNTPTTAPTNTPTTAPTNTPIPNSPDVSASMADGASFDTETATVKLTLNNAEKGTYSVDDGPVKKFTGSANVVIGKGKIADSDVTVKVTATGDGKTTEKTFTYRKHYVAEVAAAPEETVEEADVNAAPDAVYATNPSGQVGTKKTITSASDFDDTMIIARGVANDDPAIFRGSHEAPKFDLYSMYGAWDDTNIYIGLQYSNVIDVVDPVQSAPQQDRGKPYSEDADIPQLLVFDTGSGDYTDGSTNDAEQTTAWKINVKYSGAAKVDRVFCYSPKKSIVNQAMFPVTGGVVDYDKLVKSGYRYVNAEKGEKYSDYAIPGVNIIWEDGFIGKTMYGIKSNGYSGYTPANLESGSAAWVDFLTETHDTKYDSFCIVTIPLSLLGVTAEHVATNGIGVMSIASYGESGIGSLPMDMTMLDNATKAYGADDSTSHEKEDADEVTTSLARLGGKADVTIAPTKVPTVTEEATPTPTEAVATVPPTPTDVPTDVLHVNFGADRSAPQYNTTALSIKAIAAGGTEPYNYEFFVDGTSVQNGTNDTYTWQNGSAEAHKIKVVVTDATGKTVSSEKDYDLEGNGDITATPIPTVDATATPSAVPTKPSEPTPTISIPTETPSLLALTKFTITCKTEDGNYKVGDEFVMRAESTGANGTPQYMFTYILNGEEVIVKNYGPENEASFIADVAGAYGFRVYVVDNGNTDSPSVETGEIIVQANANAAATPTVNPGTTGNPTATVTPKVTETPVITGIIPTPTSKVTVAPVKTATPMPVKTATPKPIETVTPTTSGSETVAKGTVVVDDATESDYTIVSTGSKKEVEFTEYFGTETNFVIPDTIKVGNVYYKVTSIKENAFKNNKKMKTVTIGKNVTKIGNSAFYGCTSLQKVKGAKNVKTIGDKAFYNCKKLTTITLSSKLTTIGKYAFYKCTSLKKITIPSKVSKIGMKAFYGCKKLKTITIKTTKLKSSKVGKQAFKGIYSKATIKVPKSKLSSYKKLLKSKGVSSKAKIKK